MNYEITAMTRKPAQKSSLGVILQRKCNTCYEKNEVIQRATADSSIESVPPIVQEVLRTPGHPLDNEARALMEPRFGRDFSNVRVHTDVSAAKSAKAVNALAYAVGPHLVFDEAQLSPKTRKGSNLLAHELAHTLQQPKQFGSLANLRLGPRHSPEEETAKRYAEASTMDSVSNPQCCSNLASSTSLYVAREYAGENWAQVHQRILKGLIEIAKKYSEDGEARRQPIQDLFASVPQEQAKRLYNRLQPGAPTDDFAQYLKNKFPQNRAVALKILAEKSSIQQTSTPVPKESGPIKASAREGSEVFGYDLDQAKSSPLYIDNFIEYDYFPSERIVSFCYPNGIVLGFELKSLLEGMEIKSELVPKKQAPPEGSITIAGIEVFEKNLETGIIVPSGVIVGRVFTPRMYNLISEIEKARPDQEIFERAAPAILGVITNMNTSPPVGFGRLLVRIGRWAKGAGSAVGKGTRGLFGRLSAAPAKATPVVSGTGRPGSLRVIQGGGQTTPQHRGHLRVVGKQPEPPPTVPARQPVPKVREKELAATGTHGPIGQPARRSSGTTGARRDQPPRASGAGGDESKLRGAEHTSKARPSTRSKHQEGLATKQKQQQAADERTQATNRAGLERAKSQALEKIRASVKNLPHNTRAFVANRQKPLDARFGALKKELATQNSPLDLDALMRENGLNEANVIEFLERHGLL